jgi:hypothetical protein
MAWLWLKRYQKTLTTAGGWRKRSIIAASRIAVYSGALGRFGGLRGRRLCDFAFTLD